MLIQRGWGYKMSQEQEKEHGLEEAVNGAQNTPETQKQGKNEHKNDGCKCSDNNGCGCSEGGCEGSGNNCACDDNASQELEAKASEAEHNTPESKAEVEEKLEEYKDPITEEYVITRRNDVFFHEVYAYEVWTHKDKFFNDAMGF